MRHVTAVIVLLSLAGCTADRNLNGNPGHGVMDAAASDRVHGGSLKPRSALAASPDRGELLTYPRGRRMPPAVGAYTSYPVELSEAHAIGAIASGELRVTAPDGSLLRLRYERHVEHSDGNWTWVGRLPGVEGEEAILTFGEHAVYGSIPQGGERLPLRVTMSGGRSWLVATDPRSAAALDKGTSRPSRPDYFMPLNAALDQGVRRPLKRDYFVPPAFPVRPGDVIMPKAVDERGAKAITVVDVVLGYTPGFRDGPAIGGDSQARTRLNFLIAVSNQALANSQLSVQFRLVHAMLVNYPDATDNGATLEQLTGFRAPSTPLTPAPEFAALRAARDQYGADLVSLVRRYQRPQNNGCGIAWLIGGGRSEIGSGSEYFGYSVVSDGFVSDGSTTYFCLDETLAHEFSHNLGSQHDLVAARGDDGVLDDDEYGRFDYSFGHKTNAAAGNFFTVMAYGDSGQVRNRVFSNPRVATCGQTGNRPCGIENQADNARSLAQTAPMIATFRPAVPPGTVERVRNDVDADGKSDLLWSRQMSGQFVSWRMNGATLAGTRSYAVSTTFKAIGSGDLDGNSHVDVVWMDMANGDVHAWLGQTNGTYVSRLVYRLGTSWTLAGTGDVNADGKDDLLWSRPSTGQFVYWLMNGGVLAGSRGFAMSAAYTAIGAGDIDGNGRVDVLWRDASGNIQAWLGLANGNYDSRFVYQLATSWKLIGTGDANGDGKDDLLWSRPASSQFVRWLMNGSMIAGSGGFAISSAFSGIGSGDFDGNGRVDVIWRNSAGDTYVWLGQASGYAPQFVYRLTGWQLLP